MGFSPGFSDAFDKDYMKLLSDLNLSRDFLGRLGQDDDWSFVVKLHALMEIAISHLLTERLGSQLDNVFTRLDMSNKDFGKMKFVKALSLVEKETQVFIGLLGEMRNAFVHDIRMTSGGIIKYLTQLKGDKKKQDRYNKWMQLWEHYGQSEEIILEVIRPLMIVQATVVLSEIYFAKEKFVSRRRMEAVEFFIEAAKKIKPS